MRAIDDHLTMRSRTAACALIAALMLAGGCDGAGDEDKAGSAAQDKPVELVVANHEGGFASVTAWAEAVERLSEGSIQVRASNNWRQGETDYEQATIGDVQRRRVDLAVVAARAFDEVGVTSFQPLVAPLLIDTPELERRVLLGEVGRRALAGTADLGLVGLALMPNSLRRPVGLSRTLVAPGDYEGARVYTREGNIPRATLEALGARPVHLPTESWYESVDGAEVSLNGVRGAPKVAHRAARIAANVVLWPQTMTIVMNQQAFDELSEDQQTALREAGSAAFEPAARVINGLAEEDRDVLCRIGAKFVEATPAQVEALQTAVQPVYRTIERSPGNAEAIASIRELKGDSGPQTLACLGSQAPASSSETPASGTAGDAPELEGTYRMHLTEKELADSPLLVDQAEVNDENWGELALTLSDGRARYSISNDRAAFEVSGRYTTEGDVIKLHFDEIGETWGFRWSLYRGTLKLERDETLGIPPELHAPTPLLVKSWERVR